MLPVAIAMTMWSMRTLPKRNKLIAVLTLLLVISGCSGNDVPTASDVMESGQTAPQPVSGDMLLSYWRIGANQPILAYDAMGELVATIEVDSVVTLAQQGYAIGSTIYQQLENTNWYIKTDAPGINEDTSWYLNPKHLIPLGIEATIKAGSTITDFFDTSRYTLAQPLTVDVITMDESKIGFYFQNDLVYANITDIDGTIEKPTLTNPDSVDVLMYHFFYDPAIETPQDGNDVSTTDFQGQLEALNSNNVTLLTMQELYHYLNDSGQVPDRSMVLTIDDGDESVYRLGYPLIKQAGVNATLFVICGWFSDPRPYEFTQMAQDGIELQSHGFLMHQGGCSGMGHGGLLQCVDFQQGVDDTLRSLAYVDQGFVYCYPFGDVNDHAVEILKQAGVKMAFTTEYGSVSIGDDPYHLKRIRISGSDGVEGFKSKLNLN